MKQGKLKKLLHGVAVGVCLSPWAVSYAAQEQMLWGKSSDLSLLKNFTFVETSTLPHNVRLPHHLTPEKNTANSFQLLSGHLDFAKTSHIRYDQYFQGIPVWSSQVIYHVSPNGMTSVTGSVVDGIEQDVRDVTGKISIDHAIQIATGNKSVSRPSHAEKIIFFDAEFSDKAALAWHVSYLTQTSNGPALLSYIIDANNGKILQQWDALPHAEMGQGMGGVGVQPDNRIPYRSGKFQYGTSQPGVNSLGMLEVQYNNGRCTFASDLVRVTNLQNQREGRLPFELPASRRDEMRYAILQPFSYACSAPTYLNSNDGGTASINDGMSPVNDVSYFVEKTFDMLINQYGLAAPAGAQLPIRIHTHVAGLNNAFACGIECMRESGVSGPQQVVFGNGGIGKKNGSSPLTDGDGVAHEFGHIVTEHLSNLKYEEQSGAINEAFSDMTGIAIMAYVRNTLGYAWYWDGLDWTTGRSISKSGTPMRYYDMPSKDGHSIDKASQFRRGMEVHSASGVFNRVFYLMSTSIASGWTIEKAYQVMLDANQNFWTPGATFQTAACGVLKATHVRGYSEPDVKAAFQKIDINLDNCPV